jgi:predicted site-specific integrase-resolvase
MALYGHMKLSDWARRHGISYKTAWRWWKAGILPVPARRLPTGTILVEEAAAPEAEGEVVVYARVRRRGFTDGVRPAVGPGGRWRR